MLNLIDIFSIENVSDKDQSLTIIFHTLSGTDLCIFFEARRVRKKINDPELK